MKSNLAMMKQNNIVILMNSKLKPFLRWAGGKYRLVNRLVPFLPQELNSNFQSTYFEPFLGAGSLFFKISPDKAYLSDINNNLLREVPIPQRI